MGRYEMEFSFLCIMLFGGSNYLIKVADAGHFIIGEAILLNLKALIFRFAVNESNFYKLEFISRN